MAKVANKGKSNFLTENQDAEPGARSHGLKP